MKSIAQVATLALESADKDLYSDGWADKYRDLHRAWLEMRRQNGGFTKSMNEWRDSVSSHIKSLIDHYKDGKADRSMWVESMNLRASITVMGGLRGCSKWEVDVAVGIVDHSNKTRVFVA
jgi:hypothetical protein